MKFIHKIYNPTPLNSKNGNFKNKFNHELIEFSLGRQALFHILKFLSQQSGKKIKIALPRFICDEVERAVIDAGVSISWFKVQKFDFHLSQITSDDIKDCDAVLLVNYFALAADIENIKAINPNIIVIEDNAHGFLSQDQKGNWLGTRGDFGVYSLRKTLPVSLGAAAWVSEKYFEDFKKYYDNIPKKIINVSFNKKWARIFSNYIPVTMFYKFVQIWRIVNKFRRQPKSVEDYSLDTVIFPESYLKILSVIEERKRRTELYLACVVIFKKYSNDVEIIEYAKNEVPYCFAFLLKSQEQLNTIRSQLQSEGLDLVSWPTLPNFVLNESEEWYHDVYFIPFLW